MNILKDFPESKYPTYQHNYNNYEQTLYQYHFLIFQYLRNLFLKIPEFLSQELHYQTHLFCSLTSHVQSQSPIHSHSQSSEFSASHLQSQVQGHSHSTNSSSSLSAGFFIKLLDFTYIVWILKEVKYFIFQSHKFHIFLCYS